jgi:hypothetical protein
MPTLTINGRKVTVGDEFMQLPPDQQDATVDEIAQGMGPQVGTGEDVIRSGAAGVGQGVVGLAGMPGDLTHIDPISQGLGISVNPDQRSEMERLGLIPPQGSGLSVNLPTSSDLQQKANDATRGPGGQSFMEYQPQTTAGEVATRAGRLAPSVMLGPGSLMQKGAMLAGGTTGGEVGQRAGKAIGHEHLGDFVGTMAGVGLPALAHRAPGETVPTTQDYQRAKNAAYSHAKASGNTLPAQDFAQIVNDLGNFAVNNGANRRLTPNVRSALKALDERARIGGDLSVDEIDQMRKTLKMGADAMKPEERRLIQRLVSEFDKRVDAVVPPELKEARRLNVRYKKSEMMDDMEANAELRAGQYSQSGSENAIRTEYRQLARNKRKMRQFDPEERAAIRKVAIGGTATNAARWLGKFAPNSVVSALPTILSGGMIGGLTGDAQLGALVSSAVAGAGVAGKTAASLLTNHSARLAEELIRAGKGGAAAARSVRNDKRLEALARALIAGDSSAHVPVEQLNGGQR